MTRYEKSIHAQLGNRGGPGNLGRQTTGGDSLGVEIIPLLWLWNGMEMIES